MKIYLFAALTAFAFSLALCFLLIPLLKKWKAGQNILVFVKEHKGKSGTPTMGGLAFVVATVATAVGPMAVQRQWLLTLLMLSSV